MEEGPAPPSEAAAASVEQAYDDAFHQDTERARQSIETLRTELVRRRIFFGDNPLPTSVKPHFIAREHNDDWNQRLATLLGLVERTARSLSDNKAFRTDGPFSPEAWELFDIDPGYDRLAVVCRPDVVWEGSRIGLLEINADSPAMMLYADMVQDIQRDLFPMTEIDGLAKLKFERRTPVLLDTLLTTYREWGGSKPNPTIAIVDWRDQKTSSEQERQAEVFTALGCPSFVCSPDQLELHGGTLHGAGHAIDIIQRRMLFPQIVQRRAELGALLTAYRERQVCMVNPLSSYLVGCKAILAELCRLARRSSLSEEDRDTVLTVLPCTLSPDDQEMQEEIAERSKWVLKPAFGAGGSGVVIGRFATKETWDDVLKAARHGEWVVQKYLPIPLYRVPLSTSSTHVATPLYANWNPFIFGGKVAGGIARVSSDPVVGISARGALLPSVLVDVE